MPGPCGPYQGQPIGGSFADYLLGDTHATDAGLLADYLGLPFLAYPIGICWSLLSLWLMWTALKAACSR